MFLQTDEVIIRTYRRYTPLFLWVALKMSFVSLPFYFVATFFSGILSGFQMSLVYSGIAVFFILLIIYQCFIYFSDKLLITSKRIVHVNWKSFFSKDEKEIEIDEITDIETEEKGIFSFIKILDYGVLLIGIDSFHPSIIFSDIYNPEGVRDFIYHLQLKHSKIKEPAVISNSTYDRTGKKA